MATLHLRIPQDDYTLIPHFMKDTFNKQKGLSKKNVAMTGVGFTKSAFNELDERCMNLSSSLIDAKAQHSKLNTEHEELKKQKQIADERNKALSSEVLSLRTVVVQLCKERFGV